MRAVPRRGARRRLWTAAGRARVPRHLGRDGRLGSVRKILSTMPADAAGTLSRPQVADLVAYVLQSNQFPAGSVRARFGRRTQPDFACGARTSASTAVTGSTMAFPAAGTLNQVMRGVLFPSSNVLFDVQTQDPGARKAGAKRRGRDDDGALRRRLRAVAGRRRRRHRDRRVGPDADDAGAPLRERQAGAGRSRRLAAITCRDWWRSAAPPTRRRRAATSRPSATSPTTSQTPAPTATRSIAMSPAPDALHAPLARDAEAL